MLPKQYRLQKNYHFKATYRLKNSYVDRNLIMYAGKTKESEEWPTKVGFVVSKKFHKRAIKRNRTKRIMREAYRALLKENKIDKAQRHISIVFLARNGALNANYQQIYNSIKYLVNKRLV